MSDPTQKKKQKIQSKWTRTTVLIRDDHLEKFKVLAWWERTTIKELFEDMIEKYLSSKDHIDSLINAREKKLESGIVAEDS
ncbi:MAG TPA: hypothetical protein VLE95_07715 [Chlamydiales bacterium]|nr:hypothetical protein [Chlamydiales bacterium]